MAGGRSMKRTLTAGGSVVVPPEIRTKLGLRQGDQLDFLLTEDGKVQIQKAAANTDPLKGLAGRFAQHARSSPVSQAEMDEAIRDAAAQRSKR